MEWQPIETAPKDGSLFLGWVDAVQYVEDDDGRPYEKDVSCVDFCEWRYTEGCPDGWAENMIGYLGDSQYVSHWMPLPEPPK